MKGIIKLVYRKIIDSTASGMWEKQVFDATHKEFFMQAQEYDRDKKNETFGELQRNIPRASDIHYLVSTAAVNYIRQLNDLIPDVVDQQGQRFLHFKNFRFELIESHVHDKKLHRVCIYFYSNPYCWVDSIGDTLVLANASDEALLLDNQEVNLNLVAMNAGLSIHSIRTSKVMAV
jgi:hypothetical protein